MLHSISEKFVENLKQLNKMIYQIITNFLQYIKHYKLVFRYRIIFVFRHLHSKINQILYGKSTISIRNKLLPNDKINTRHRYDLFLYATGATFYAPNELRSYQVILDLIQFLFFSVFRILSSSSVYRTLF